jgi:hypothetical protein
VLLLLAQVVVQAVQGLLPVLQALCNPYSYNNTTLYTAQYKSMFYYKQDIFLLLIFPS